MESIKRRLEGEIEIRVAGGDAFHEIFLSRPHHISNISSEFVQDCELHEGSFGKQGSKICWRLTVGTALQPNVNLNLFFYIFVIFCKL